jgi:CRP-like cAMP-binding protein
VAEAIAPLLVQLTVIPGDVIMRQGHRTSCLYLVQYGEFIVTINDERDEGDAAAEPQPMTDFCDHDSSQREVALLSDGDIFGEISFLDPTRCRNATVTATAPGRIFSLVHSHFSAICKDDPDLLRRVQVTALERITHNAVVTHNLT